VSGVVRGREGGREGECGVRHHAQDELDRLDSLMNHHLAEPA